MSCYVIAFAHICYLGLLKANPYHQNLTMTSGNFTLTELHRGDNILTFVKGSTVKP